MKAFVFAERTLSNAILESSNAELTPGLSGPAQRRDHGAVAQRTRSHPTIIGAGRWNMAASSKTCIDVPSRTYRRQASRYIAKAHLHGRQ